MTTTTFDTLQYAKKLKKAGFTEQQAEIQAEALADFIENNLATKRDLKELELALKNDIKQLEEFEETFRTLKIDFDNGKHDQDVIMKWKEFNNIQSKLDDEQNKKVIELRERSF